MYDIHIKFNDAHIPGSPFRVHISPDSGVARNVTVHSLKDRGLQVQPGLFSDIHIFKDLKSLKGRTKMAPYICYLSLQFHSPYPKITNYVCKTNQNRLSMALRFGRILLYTKSTLYV